MGRVARNSRKSIASILFGGGYLAVEFSDHLGSEDIAIGVVVPMNEAQFVWQATAGVTHVFSALRLRLASYRPLTAGGIHRVGRQPTAAKCLTRREAKDRL